MHEGNDMSIMITLKNLPQKGPPPQAVSRVGEEEDGGFCPTPQKGRMIRLEARVHEGPVFQGLPATQSVAYGIVPCA